MPKTINNSIKIKGARVHNLKNINVEIPRDKFTVITGLSGSGKSSLAFDTIYAEGQRRYVESLSAYARQFAGIMDKPDVDLIEGLSPAIAIDQKSCSQNPRSTVGTVTEIYDYLRLLFARIGVPHCPKCGKKIRQYSINKIVKQVLASFDKKEIIVLSPIIKDKKGEHKNILDKIAKAGCECVRYDNKIYSLKEVEDMKVDKQKKHNVDIVIGALTVNKNKEGVARLTEAIKKALDLSNGLITILSAKNNSPQPYNNKTIKQSAPNADKKNIQETSNNEIKEITFSMLFTCPDCGINLPELEPRNFSFNSPHGACPDCSGLGTKLKVDPQLIINPNLTIAQGAIKPWARNTSMGQSELTRALSAVAKKHGFDLNTPIKNLSKKQLNIALYGVGGKSRNADYACPACPEQNLGEHGLAENECFSRKQETEFEGVIPNLEKRYKQTESDYVRSEIENYMRVFVCPSCKGKRLKPEMLSVKTPSLSAGNNGLSINDITTKDIKSAEKFFIEMEKSKKLSARNKKISAQIIKEILIRIGFLLNVGLDYLTLDRAANTLSGGEAQRIRLATQIGSALTGVIYILDEPSIGLHQKDNDKLIKTLKKLRNLGNTVIVVEHDEATMLAADHIIDVGPGAGEHGGEIIAEGPPEQIKKHAKSLTGQYLSGKKSIPIPMARAVSLTCEMKSVLKPPCKVAGETPAPMARAVSLTCEMKSVLKPPCKVAGETPAPAGKEKKITIIGASEHNLKNIDVEFPLGKFIAITGVSGSGKSTLMTDILANALSQKFYRAKTQPGAHKSIEGLEHIDKVINIDQSPIGRTPRSNPATYTGAFTPIRELFASLPEAKMKGYKAGQFSFNVAGGRCEACSGDGMVKIEMQFLPNVYVECDACHGKRYNKKVLEIYYKNRGYGAESLSAGKRGKNISDALNMTVEEAIKFFKNIPAISQKLSTLNEVGLGYIKLGQSATTLSGGEAQRIKLATELSRRATGKTLYILDEPTTGLHFDDIKKLLRVLNQLVNKGNTVLIIEHNMDVIKSVDWIIDLGPEGGDKGGKIVAVGAPKDIAKNKKSHTGKYLAKVLKKKPPLSR